MIGAALKQQISSILTGRSSSVCEIRHRHISESIIHTRRRYQSLILSCFHAATPVSGGDCTEPNQIRHPECDEKQHTTAPMWILDLFITISDKSLGGWESSILYPIGLSASLSPIALSKTLLCPTHELGGKAEKHPRSGTVAVAALASLGNISTTRINETKSLNPDSKCIRAIIIIRTTLFLPLQSRVSIHPDSLPAAVMLLGFFLFCEILFWFLEARERREAVLSPLSLSPCVINSPTLSNTARYPTPWLMHPPLHPRHPLSSTYYTHHVIHFTIKGLQKKCFQSCGFNWWTAIMQKLLEVVQS